MIEVRPLVSIIITTFNRSEYLYECLESIQNQTFQNIEILLIDDGSSDHFARENKQIADAFSKCNYYWKENTGQPDSRNYGIKRAKGDYIGFCDDDDFWALEKVESQLQVFNSNPDLYVVTCCIEYVNEESIQLNRIQCHTGFSHGYVFEHFLKKK